MKHPVSISITLLLLLSSAALGQDRLEQRFEGALIAWDEGRYIHSMELMVDILETPGGDRLLPQIALLTGDLFQVTEITTDGTQINLSPDGMFASYMVTLNGRIFSRVIPLSGDYSYRISDNVSGLEFSPVHGHAAYFKVEETRELQRAREELASVDRAADRQAWFAARQAIMTLEEENRKTFIYDLSDIENEILMELDEEGIRIRSFSFSSDGETLYTIASPIGVTSGTGIYTYPVDMNSTLIKPELLTSEDGTISNLIPVRGGRYLVYSVMVRGATPTGNQRQQGRSPATTTVCLMDLLSGDVERHSGSEAVVSADGSMLVINAGGRTVEGQDVNSFHAIPLTGGGNEKALTTWGAIRSLAISPNGENLAFQMMPDKDWEVYVLPLTGGDMVRVTRDLQHDLYPAFLDDRTLLVIRGEGRHRRSYLYNLDDLVHTRLFHNNTVRTFCPEYAWIPSADGRRILISSERDGDTISPERGVYLVDLDRRVTKEEVLDRLRGNLASERTLRRKGEQMFAPIFEEVKELTARVSITKIYDYQKALFDFDTKYIGTPGNQKAADYIFQTLQSFGYEPEYQWFEVAPRRGGTDTIRTPNVIAVLRGTGNPEIHYLLSSHFDSNQRGPGADDNSSAIAVLLETARILAEHPLPCSIIFAAFTGEEAGLLGSREFARQAVARGLIVKGALNNDMIGWSGDHRLDNTIRFSNYGIRDVQHAGAFLFSDLITYDAHYYKSTDAHALFDAFGDVIGGLGSYHVLGNPHYHQTHDALETINQELVTESCRSIVASMMLLASCPSRVEGLQIVSLSGGNSTEIRWDPNPEADITEYHIVWGSVGEPPRHDMVVTEPRATLVNAPIGTVVRVKAMNARGLLGWDWAVLTPVITP